MTAETSNARGEWVLVPREPSAGMLDSAENAMIESEWAYNAGEPDARSDAHGFPTMRIWQAVVAYRAMLAAAQPPAADCTCPHQDAREPDHDVACPARLAQQPAAGEVDDDGRDAPAQATQAVPQGWPRAAKGQRDQGWTLEYRFLERVTDLAASRTEYSTSMEATEQVLIAALEVLAAQHQEPPHDR